MVVNSLIDMLSSKNEDDLHQTLNASTVLTEFSENESFFAILTQPAVLKKIVESVTSMDANKHNQAYALNFFTQVITQFSDQDSSFFKGNKEEALDTLMSHFKDLAYNAMLVLRSGDSVSYTN